MAEFPALPLFTDAITADCYHLDDSEFGRYMRILILMWRTPKCRVPDDPAWIAKRVRIDALAYAKHVHPIMQEFCTLIDEDGAKYWVQKRLRKEYQYVQEKTEKRRAAAHARWQKDQVPDNKQKEGMQSTSKADAPTPTPTPTPTDISLPNGNESCGARDITYSTNDGRFMSFTEVVDYLWNDYPRVGRTIRHKNKFSDQLAKLLREEGKNADDWKRIIKDVAAAVRRHRHYCEETNEKPADPFRWLRDGGHKESLDYSQTPDQTRNTGSGKGSSTTDQTISAAEKAKQALRGL